MKWLREDSYGFPILLAIGLHAGIVLTGIVAVDFSDTEKQQPKRPVIVNATVVDISETIIGKREAQEKEAKKQAAVSAEKRKKEAAQQKQKEIERKALEKKKKQLAQAKKLKEKAAQDKAAREKKVAQEKAANEAAKKENERQQIAEKKRLAQEAERKQLAQESERKRLEKEKDDKQRKEQELRRQAEAERLAEEERKRQAEAARIAEEKKQAEEAVAQAAAEQERQRAVEEAQMVQSISSLINSRVTAVWNRPPSARNGMKTQLRIYFLPNGEVRDAQVTAGSGDALFDQRAIDAIYKVGRIEELADVDSYTFERNFRQIDLIFNPQDLRN